MSSVPPRRVLKDLSTPLLVSIVKIYPTNIVNVRVHFLVYAP